MTSKIALTLVALGGCLPSHGSSHGVPLQVPPAIAGSHEIGVSQGVDAPICTFRMYPAGQPDPGGNWLPPNAQINAMSGASARIKPGTYTAVAAGCENKFPEASSTVTIADNTRTVQVAYRERVTSDPTWVALIVPSPEYLTHPQPVQCIPDGGFNAPDTAYPCCSLSSHWSPERDRYVCGPGPGQ